MAEIKKYFCHVIWCVLWMKKSSDSTICWFLQLVGLVCNMLNNNMKQWELYVECIFKIHKTGSLKTLIFREQVKWKRHRWVQTRHCLCRTCSCCISVWHGSVPVHFLLNLPRQWVTCFSVGRYVMPWLKSRSSYTDCPLSLWFELFFFNKKMTKRCSKV